MDVLTHLLETAKLDISYLSTPEFEYPVIMESHKSHSEIAVGTERNFGIVFAIAFLIFGLFPLIGGATPNYWCFIVSAFFFVTAFVAPQVLGPLNVLWFKFGMLLARVIQPIVMSVIYFLVVTPIGLLMRAFGKDPLRRKLDGESETYWQERSNEADRMGSMKNQF